MLGKRFAHYLRAPEDVRARFHNLFASYLADQICVALMGVVNTMMAANVGRAVVAGVGQVDSVNNVLVNLFSAFAAGGTVAVAAFHGRGERGRAARAASQACAAGLAGALVIMAALMVFHREFLTLLFGRAEADVMEHSVSYLMWSAPSLPLAFLFSQAGGVLRGAGDGKTPLYASVVMNVLNIALGYVLIVGAFGFGGFGAAGAGLTIFLSRLAGAAVVLGRLVLPGGAVRFVAPRAFRFEREVLRTVFGIGAPAGLESMMFNSGKLVVQVILSGLGTLTISANQIASSVQSLFMIPHNVMQYMAIPIMAATAAQGVRQKTADCMRYLYRVTLIWSVAVGLVTFPLAAPLCRIFTREAEVLSVSVRLLWMSACFAPFWPAAFLIPSAFRGAGDVRVSLLWGTFTMWTCRVVLAYLLGVCLSMGVYGVWLGVYADWLLRGAVFLYRSRSGVWIPPKTSGKKGTKTQHQKAEIR